MMKRATAEQAERILKALREQERQRERIHSLYKEAATGDQIALEELTNTTLALNQQVAINLESALGALS